MGKLRAHQARYSEAHKHLTEASRKCPQDTAEKFQLTVSKHLILVTLLLGNLCAYLSFKAIKVGIYNQTPPLQVYQDRL